MTVLCSSPIALPMDALIAASISPHTLRAYTGHMRRVQAHLPGTLHDHALATHLTTRYNEGLSPATCAQMVAAVRFFARLQRRPSPVGPLTERTLAGIRRAGKARRRPQKDGLSWAQVEVIVTLSARTGGLRGLRDAALLAVMSDALLRSSEVVSLTTEDLSLQPDGSGRLLLRHSKTDPEGRGALLFLGGSTMQRVRTWTRTAALTRGAVFCRVRRGGHIERTPLTPRSVQRIVQERTRNAEIIGNFSGHSLRIGSAQSLLARGATLPETQLAGRWTSPRMVAHYGRGQRAGQGAIARLKYPHT